VDDADVVDRLEPGGDLQRDVERPVRHQAALYAHDLLEVGAADQLHRDVGEPAVLAVLVDAADVAVRDLARQLDLRLEAARHLGVRGDLGPQHLERDGLVEDAVVGLVDDAHAATAHGTQDLVARGHEHAATERLPETAPAALAGRRRGGVLGLARGAGHAISRDLTLIATACGRPARARA